MVGIDLGSRNVKIVQMVDGKVVKKQSFDTIAFYQRFGLVGEGRLSLDLAELGFDVYGELVATGYGKLAVTVEGAEQIPEIQAHVLGACYSTGFSSFTLVDIGGQDTKVVQIRNGQAVDFLTNDRCAAGSGRYLEHMAGILGMELEELGRYDQDPVHLNSTCAIFGETEVIGHIVTGCPAPRLAAGVNYAVYRKLAPMIRKLKSEVLVLSGGGALNQALGRIMSRETGCQVIQVPEPQYNGAIGCCIYRRRV